MNSIWQNLTLSTLSFQQWRSASYLHRFLSPLRRWRQSSFMLRWGDLLGAVLVSLVFAIAPFVSDDKSSLAVLLTACAGFWVLLTVSDGDTGNDRHTANELQTELLSPQGFWQTLANPGRSSPLATPIHFLVVLYWGVSAAATALSPVKRAALTGFSKLTLYLILFALMARVLRSPRVRSWVIGIYLHAALLVSSYGIQQKISGVAALATWVDPTSPSAKEPRVYSYLGNPNLLAAYLLPAIALSLVAVFAWRRWGPKLLAATMLVVNATCLYYTGSRGGWIGFAVMAFVLLALLFHWWNVSLPRFWRTLALPTGLGLIAAVIVLAVLVVEPLRDRVSSIFVGRNDSSNNFRINVWGAVVEMIKDRPILGIGPGNVAFNSIYPRYQRPRFSALSAYSIPLEIAVETGIIGLTCFAWLLLVTLNLGWSRLQQLRAVRNQDGFWLIGAIATLLGLLSHGFVDTVWYRPQVNTLWWLMIALIASYYTLPAETQTALEDV
ncbi:IctB family putative bicarbonate transporter [Stenomitos frigidus]|uniref:Putative bicarbonate transporter, IctB family n=1 Tax=Stenomitos frigidus ULC18 TaxID=2107698 RepID=A0A2T1E340_9CYAN|nr:IctB family putative bicarbonate transporter [Stenomitos frigidus]PSB27173.1 putative bicarbonate transporter, IctB family [Stenomitos frigidus ULC18]